MVNYAKRTKELIQQGGIKYFFSYSIELLKKIHMEKKQIRDVNKYLSKMQRLGGLIDSHHNTYWWNRELFDEISAADHRDYWANMKDWVYIESFPERAEKMFTFMRNSFLPLLDKTSHVAEIACASGETVFVTANYVEQVDGYEYSQFMVDKARENASKMGISNVSFTLFDATKQKLEKHYDAITVLGLFTCLFEDDAVEQIIKNIADSMEQNSYLLLKDSYHETTGENSMIPIYCYHIHTGYKAVYRSKAAFFKLMEKYGFLLEKESCLAGREKRPFDFCSVISLWKKL